MISALLAAAALATAPSPSHAFVARVDAQLKAAFLRASAVAAATPAHLARHGRDAPPLPRR